MPEYSQASYWDERFHNDPAVFEWLVQPDLFDEVLSNVLEESAVQNPQVLHIGCGTSQLSFSLRKYVSKPENITNVDFSAEAIALGRKLDNGNDQMRWQVIDLLSANQVALLNKDRRQEGLDSVFDLIIDKGTIDSTASAEDTEVSVTYMHDQELGFAYEEPGRDRCAVEFGDAPPQHASLSGPALMTLHLAALSRPGALWICISYSQERFDFLRYDLQTDPSCAKVDRISPKAYWTIDKKEPIEVPETTSNTSTSNVHRPKIFHWLYILRRLERLLVSSDCQHSVNFRDSSFDLHTFPKFVHLITFNMPLNAKLDSALAPHVRLPSKHAVFTPLPVASTDTCTESDFAYPAGLRFFRANYAPEDATFDRYEEAVIKSSGFVYTVMRCNAEYCAQRPECLREAMNRCLPPAFCGMLWEGELRALTINDVASLFSLWTVIALWGIDIRSVGWKRAETIGLERCMNQMIVPSIVDKLNGLSLQDHVHDKQVNDVKMGDY